MNKLLLPLTVFFICKPASASKEVPDSGKPNILLILADDLGYGDVGFHGSDIKTPNIDRIAKEGVQLDQFYTCPMSSPTRAGLMTGRYPLRYGLMRSVIPPYRVFGLSEDEETIAELLEKVGYKYRGIAGKWHLGHRREKWLPYNRGFTFHEGCYNGAVDYFTRERDGETDWHINSKPVKKEGYTTDLIGDASVRFINSVPAGEPFFLYVPFTAPHSPYQAKPEDMSKYPHREGLRKTYAAMVDCMDQNIGKIMKCIEERGELDNTFIIFFSDNGGLSKVSDNGKMRGEKLTPYQGGIRVAAAARWPGGGIPSGKVIAERTGYIDIVPTLLQAAGFSGSLKNKPDGIDILPALRGSLLADRDWFTYEDQGNKKVESMAVNNDRWKLVVRRSAPDSENFTMSLQLFQISDDPSETTDLSSQYPDTVNKLKRSLNRFYSLKSDKQVPRFADRKNLTDTTAMPGWQPVK